MTVGVEVGLGRGDTWSEIGLPVTEQQQQKNKDKKLLKKKKRIVDQEIKKY